MKFTEIQKMPKDELDKKLVDLRTELMKLNAQVAIGTTPKSTKQIREIKRSIAKVETLRMQKFHKDFAEMKANVEDLFPKKAKKQYKNL